MRTIAVVNQKGGCGKTTISINLASAIARTGKKTLLVDMDPQSHCAVGLAVPEEQIEQSVYDVLIGVGREEPIQLREILWEIADGFELAPANIDLAAFDQQMAGIPGREDCLRDVLDELDDSYEYAVLDCPPSVGLLTFTAIRAATDIIVPVDTGYFSLYGLSKQLDTLSVLCKQCDTPKNIKVLASMYDIRTKLGREILAELRKHFAAKMFETVINFNTKLKEAASLGQPIGEYDPASRGRKDFQALAQEIINIDVTGERREYLDSLQKQLDSISSSADDLLATVKTPPQMQKQPVRQSDTDQKLAEFYGIKHLSGAVLFSTLYPRAKNVQIAADFNNWQPENAPMKKISDNGIWQIKLPLGPGKYRYRLVVDGQWQQDPYNEQVELNPFGEFNSIVEVK